MRNTEFALGTKINVSMGVTVAFTAMLGLYAAYSLNTQRGIIENHLPRETRKVELALMLDSAAVKLQSAQRGLLLGALTNDARLTAVSVEQADESMGKIKDSIRDIEALLSAGEDRELHGQLRQSAEEAARSLGEFQSAIKEHRFDQATKAQAERFQPLFDKMRSGTEAFAALEQNRIAAASSGAATRARMSLWLALALCVLAGCISSAGFWVVARGTRDLRRIASKIAAGSKQVASAAGQVSGSSQSLAEGASEQAATLEETSASTEQINSMTQKNAENARSAAAETGKADDLLKETEQRLEQMIQSMKEINSSSEKISRIIRVIDEIAFQTNILALNAAVEAARAGEAGMGFAVVADEVRNLAQRCAQAAKDTSDLIEESIVRSNEGKARLDEVAVCVGRVVENASKIKLLFTEVHVGSQEQARGIEQISKAVEQMQKVTQSTAASAELSAAAGEEMTAQAAALHDAVGRLRDLVGSGKEVEMAPERQARRQGTPRVERLGKAVSPRGRGTAARVAAPAAASKFPLDEDFKEF